MTKTILGNTILNNTCSRILHGNSVILKNSVILILLMFSMLIIIIELIIKKTKSKNWTMQLPKGERNTLCKPV
jgi:hypothetical protein